MHAKVTEALPSRLIAYIRRKQHRDFPAYFGGPGQRPRTHSGSSRQGDATLALAPAWGISHHCCGPCWLSEPANAIRNARAEEWMTGGGAKSVICHFPVDAVFLPEEPTYS